MPYASFSYILEFGYANTLAVALLILTIFLTVISFRACALWKIIPHTISYHQIELVTVKSNQITENIQSQGVLNTQENIV